MDSIGQRIRKIREMRNFTQKALAEKAQMHEVTLRYYEIGVRKPKPDQLQKLAEALEVDIAFLYPTKTDTPMALYALLFDLVDQFGDVVMEQKGGTVLFGIDHYEYPSKNIALTLALNAHDRMSPDEFKKWLIDNPPLYHNGQIVSRDAVCEEE